jgi:hypothetical protein
MSAAALLSLIGGVAHAQLSVELQQNASDQLRVSGLYANTYYDGGYAGNTPTSGPVVSGQYGPGPSLGFTLSTDAAILLSGTSSTQGRFLNLPTDGAPGDGNTQALSFNTTYPTVTTVVNAINFAAGFTGVTFNYSFGDQNQNLQTAQIWSGQNGTGTLLDTINLSLGTFDTTFALNSSTTMSSITSPPHADVFYAWSQASDNSFSGVGESVTFGTSTSTTSPDLEIDAFTVVSVPEPASYALAGAGLIVFFLGSKLRRQRA